VILLENGLNCYGKQQKISFPNNLKVLLFLNFKLKESGFCEGGFFTKRLIYFDLLLFLKMKKEPHCDYEGTCKNKAYREVYPKVMGGKHKKKGWSYLCKKHYYQEEKKYNWKLPSCSLD